MKLLLQDVRKKDARALWGILLLNIVVALTGGLGTVMLVPMLDFLEIQVTGSGTVAALLRPFASLSYLQRAGVIISAFVVIMLFRAVISRVAAVKQNKFLEHYEMALRAELYDAITGAQWQTLAAQKQSDLSNLFLVQCRQARFCLSWVIGLASSAANALLQLAIACWLSLPVTVMVLIVGVAFLALFRPLLKRSKACGEQAVEVSRAMYREIQNQLGGIKEARAYGVEQENRSLFQRISQDYFNISLRTTHLRVLPQLCYSIASAVLIALAFVISVLVLKTDTARLVILVYIFSRLWPVFSSWQGQMQNIQSYLPAFEKIREMLASLPREEVCDPGGEPVELKREITFRHVGFTYRDASEPVLEDVSFTLPFGTVTALCGRSGAGKSTTADLLLGLLQPTSGQIMADDTVLRMENASRWRRAMGYVPQDPLIIDDTVRENLRRFHPDATEEELIEALKKAQAWDFVEKLEHGLDTVLGAKGVRLSGGEGQRIVLARVLLGQPRLIILDEATSALDYESEAMIQKTIRDLKGKTTVLIIAHRLATIRSADRAIVLEDGHVAESGDLNALLRAEDGYLARMVTVE